MPFKKLKSESDMSVVLLEPTHWPPTPNNLFLHNYLDSPLEYTLNCLENIFETLVTSFFFFFFQSYVFVCLRYKDSMQLIAMANKNPIPPHTGKHPNPQVPLA